MEFFRISRVIPFMRHALVFNVISAVTFVLAVLFLGHVVSWNGESDLLSIGASIAMVIAALAYFLSTVKGGKG